MTDERLEGIIDVEALIMTTLLLMEQDRTATDLPAWLNRFSGLVNHQKLKTMFQHQCLATSVDDCGKGEPVSISRCSQSIRDIFNLKRF